MPTRWLAKRTWPSRLIEISQHASAARWEPQQAWVRAHVELASLYKERGENAKAFASLTEFLGLWKDADPDLPLLKEARQFEEQLAH